MTIKKILDRNDIDPEENLEELKDIIEDAFKHGFNRGKTCADSKLEESDQELFKKEKAKDYADVTAKDIHSKSILVPRDQLHIILSQLDFLESSLEFECLNVSGGELVWVEKEQGFGQVIETDMSVDEINYHVKVKLWNDENKTFRLDDIKTVTAPSGTEPNYNPCDIAGLSKKKDNEDDIDEE